MDHVNYSVHEKRVYRRLTLAERFQILEEAENGMKNKDLAEKYQVRPSSISKTLANKNTLLERKEIIEKYGGNKKSKKYCQVHESLFERSLYEWFTERRALGEPVSGPLIRATAKEIHKRFHGETNFAASEGWLAKFKKRHGIRYINAKGEQLSAADDDDDATTIHTELKDFVEIHGYEIDNIYNDEESSLFLKKKPNKTFVCRHEAGSPGRKVSKSNQIKRNQNRVTIQNRSRVSGSHKMRPRLAGPVDPSSHTIFPQLMSHIPGCEQLTPTDIENWLEQDSLVPPWKPYSLEKIIKMAENADEDSFNDDSEEELQSFDDDDDASQNLAEEHSPSIDELLKYVLCVRDWCRTDNQTTVAENCALDSLKERLLCLKLNM